MRYTEVSNPSRGSGNVSRIFPKIWRRPHEFELSNALPRFRKKSPSTLISILSGCDTIFGSTHFEVHALPSGLHLPKYRKERRSLFLYFQKSIPLQYLKQVFDWLHRDHSVESVPAQTVAIDDWNRLIQTVWNWHESRVRIVCRNHFKARWAKFPCPTSRRPTPLCGRASPVKWGNCSATRNVLCL